MAYNAKGLRKQGMSFVGAGSVKNIWFYVTADARATVEAANYFTDNRLSKGDLIMSAMALSGTPVTETYIITAFNASNQATIARESATGLTDQTAGTPGSTLALNAVKQTAIIPLALATLANAQVRKIAMPFAGIVNGTPRFRVGNPATTAAKLATLTTQVNGVACTGGIIALTSANCTPAGAAVAAGAAVTAGGAFTAGQTIEAAVSAVTAFVEGDGYVEYDVINSDLANAIASLNAA